MKAAAAEVWARLRSRRGPGSDGGGSPLDFTNLQIPARDARVLRGVLWNDLDVSDSDLQDLRVFSSAFENCRFNACSLEGARFWSTTIRNCSFRGASFRGAALGGIEDGLRNLFHAVDFSEADLCRTSYRSAAFERCEFTNTAIKHVDFQGSTFVDCTFGGVLDDVLFYRHGFGLEHLPPNEMAHVDFSAARLRHVSFRGLTLETVRFPEDEEHLVIPDYPGSLKKLNQILSAQADTEAKRLVAFISIRQRWAAPNQIQGLINLEDVRDAVGDEGVKRLVTAAKGAGLIAS
jgi:uncharacterized protein YjbI with pentapeptide repeats